LEAFLRRYLSREEAAVALKYTSPHLNSMNELWRKIVLSLGQVFVIVLLGLPGWALSATVVKENPVRPRPIIVPVPELTTGVARTITVVGSWKTIHRASSGWTLQNS
jgi:hypothetical protein